MPAKTISFLFIAGFLALGRLASASLVINEIMYAPSDTSDREWVEIYNSGSAEVDLKDYRFFHGETNSGPLTLRSGGTTVLKLSEYAIIGKSPSVVGDYDWLNFSGMILSASTLTLPDSGDNTHIAISDSDKNILDFVKYDPSLGGSKDSGNSLSKINGAWQGAAPTPGAANVATAPGNNTGSVNVPSGAGSQNESTGGNPGNPTPGSVSLKRTEEKITAKILGKNLAFAGVPISLRAEVLGYTGEQIYYGKFFWNFGDGETKETAANTREPLSHTYSYSGDYVVSLGYYLDSYNSYSGTPSARDSLSIKVVEANISISKVGGREDFFVELSNNTSYDADISGWTMSAGAKSFTFPQNTVLASKKKIAVSPALTGFSFEKKDTLRLATPQGKIIFDYGASITPMPDAKQDAASPIAKKEAKVPDESLPSDNGIIKNGDKVDEKISPILEIQKEALAATPVLSEEAGENYFSYPSALAALGVVAVSAGAVYFIRRKKLAPGEDFKILDE